MFTLKLDDMKTPQQLSEMAEREADKLNREPNGEYQEGFIKGYQAAQEEMKLLIEEYAEFVVLCDRNKLPLLCFEDWLNKVKNL